MKLEYVRQSGAVDASGSGYDVVMINLHCPHHAVDPSIL